MSRLGSVVICWMLVLTVVTPAGGAAGVAAAAGNGPVEVSPSPGATTVSEGESVQVEYRINTTNSSVYAYDIVLAYGDIRVTDISEGPFLRSGIERTLDVTTTVNNTAGVARIARSRIGNTSATGDGVLFTVTYTTAQPATNTTETVTMPDPRFLDRDGAPVDAVGNDTTVTVRVPREGTTDGGGDDTTGSTTSRSDADTPQTAVELINRTDSKLVARINGYELGDRINISPDGGIGNGNVTIRRVTAQYDLGTSIATDLRVAVTAAPPSSVPTYDPAADNRTVGYVTATQDGVLADRMERGRFVFELADDTRGDGTSPNAVTILRYHDGEWAPITTEHLGNGSYVGTTPGYSTFAVVVPGGTGTGEVVTTTTTADTDTPTETRTGTTRTEAGQSAGADTATESPGGQESTGVGATGIVAVIAVVVVAGVGMYLLRQ